MKVIKLGQKDLALVDNEDFEFLNRWKWYSIPKGNTFYAIRQYKENNKKKHIYMHRVILQTNSNIDHKDNNGLNNQKYNLREANPKQNAQNRRKIKKCSSKYKGVSWNKECKKWRAYIKLNGKEIHLGLFSEEKSAARTYNRMAYKLFGQFANLNKVF